MQPGVFHSFAQKTLILSSLKLGCDADPPQIVVAWNTHAPAANCSLAQEFCIPAMNAVDSINATGVTKCTQTDIHHDCQADDLR